MSTDHQSKPITLADWFHLTFVIAAIVLAVGLYMRFVDGEVEYRGTPENPCRYIFNEGECVKGHNTEWTLGEQMAEWSLTYLIVAGGIYAVLRLFGGGRIRRSLRWFWRGDEGKR